MRKDGFTVCAKHYIKCLRQEGRYAVSFQNWRID